MYMALHASKAFFGLFTTIAACYLARPLPEECIFSRYKNSKEIALLFYFAYLLKMIYDFFVVVRK